MITDLWFYVLLFFAAWRVTHLITDDRITQVPRDWLIIKTGGERDSTLSYLWTCTFCAGTYVAAGFAYLAYAHLDLDVTTALMLWPTLGAGIVVIEAAVERLIGD